MHLVVLGWNQKGWCELMVLYTSLDIELEIDTGINVCVCVRAHVHARERACMWTSIYQLCPVRVTGNNDTTVAMSILAPRLRFKVRF